MWLAVYNRLASACANNQEVAYRNGIGIGG